MCEFSTDGFCETKFGLAETFPAASAAERKRVAIIGRIFNLPLDSAVPAFIPSTKFFFFEGINEHLELSKGKPNAEIDYYLKTMQHLSDEVLIGQSREGDMNAFKMIVNRYEGKVANVVKSMLGNTTEAEDVGQEVFIRFFEGLSQFRGASLLSTYLVRIAMNLSLNELKKRKRNFLRFVSQERADHKPMIDATDLGEQLEWAIAQLEPDFRSVLVLRLVEGYSTEETAQLLNIPLGTTLSRLARAQQKLRKILTEETAREK